MSWRCSISVVVKGNLAELSSADRLHYYKAVCESVGLNPLTRPLDYLTLNGKLQLYANKDAAAQLRKRHGVSIEKPLETSIQQGIYVVTAYAKDKDGRTDSAIGAVPIEGLKGEALANAMMKCETKAKRRVTLSICGLGMLDETEAETIPGAMVGEPAVAHAEDQADRKLLLDEIATHARALGFTKAEYKKSWHQWVGNATEEAAPFGALLKLAGSLEARVKAMQVGDPAPVEVIEPAKNEVPF